MVEKSEVTISRVHDLVQGVQTYTPVVRNLLLTDILRYGKHVVAFDARQRELEQERRVVLFPRHETSLPHLNARTEALKLLGPNFATVKVYDADRFGDLLYLVCEPGEDFADYIMERHLNPQHSIGSFVPFARDILEGLDFFHRLDAYDRAAYERFGGTPRILEDIKPSNLLLVRDQTRHLDERFRVKFNDIIFSDMIEPGVLEKVVSSDICEEGIETLSTEQHNRYTAPEVRAGGTITQQANIYSIGALLFEFLTGTVPAYGQYDPRVGGRDLPAWTTVFLSLMLTEDPAKRSNAFELIQRLERLSDSTSDPSDSFQIESPVTKELEIMRLRYPNGQMDLYARAVSLDGDSYLTHIHSGPYQPHPRSVAFQSASIPVINTGSERPILLSLPKLDLLNS